MERLRAMIVYVLPDIFDKIKQRITGFCADITDIAKLESYDAKICNIYYDKDLDMHAIKTDKGIFYAPCIDYKEYFNCAISEDRRSFFPVFSDTFQNFPAVKVYKFGFDSILHHEYPELFSPEFIVTKFRFAAKDKNWISSVQIENKLYAAIYPVSLWDNMDYVYFKDSRKINIQDLSRITMRIEWLKTLKKMNISEFLDMVKNKYFDMKKMQIIRHLESKFDIIAKNGKIDNIYRRCIAKYKRLKYLAKKYYERVILLDDKLSISNLRLVGLKVLDNVSPKEPPLTKQNCNIKAAVKFRKRFSLFVSGYYLLYISFNINGKNYYIYPYKNCSLFTKGYNGVRITDERILYCLRRYDPLSFKTKLSDISYYKWAVENIILE